MKGKVYLVGAGPGDAGLLTVKGERCLRGAGAVVYDALVNPELLSLAPGTAKMVYVGKRGAVHALEQDGINNLLVELSRSYGSVVRLKGGDPFIFGRGGEEAKVLADLGVPFEIVPGVSSAVAAPAYAGIPVTDRRHTSLVTFATGHMKKDGELDLPWQSLASGGGTIVFLMGISSLSVIVKKLIEAGKDPSTPAAVISNGTTLRQATVTGPLKDIAEIVEKAGIKAPAVTVVGSVTTLRKDLAWFEDKPLFGKKVVVTRSRAQASVMVEQLKALGADVIAFPTIKIEPSKNFKALDKAIKELASYDWVIFTSVNGVQVFFERLKTLGLDARRFGCARVAAIGPATAEGLRSRGLEADSVPPEYVSESIIRKLGKVKGLKILLPRAAAARDTLHKELKRGGALVTEIPTYYTRPDKGNFAELAQSLREGAVSLVTFTSSSTVEGFLANFGGQKRKLLKGVAMGSIGPVTSAALKSRGFRPDFEARQYTIPGLVDAALAYFKRKKK